MQAVKPPPSCSLLMLTKNEAARPNLDTILDVYTRGKFFGEIIALDDSSDETVPLLRKYGVRVEKETIPRTFAERKNHLQDQARFDWVYHCDADEFIDWNLLCKLDYWTKTDSPERKPNVVAFKFPRINQHHVYPDWQIRLMNRQYVKWAPPEPHAIPVLKSTGHPVDEPQRIGNESICYCQTLISHPIIHIPRDLEYDKQVQARWKQLSGVPT